MIKKSPYFVSIFSGITLAVLALYFFGMVVPSKVADHDLLAESPKKRPKIVASAEELAVNQRYIEKSRSVRILKNASVLSSYADGLVKGTWSNVQFLAAEKQSYGYRVDGSVYDQQNDVLYAVTFAGHLWRIDRDENTPQNTRWSLINHKDNFKSFIEGLNKMDGSFRMVRSSEGKIQYSDDEGRNWANATGVQFQASTTEGAVVKYNNWNRIAVCGQTDASTLKPYFSTDNGNTFYPSVLSFSKSSNTVKIFKPCFSESVFMAVWNKTTTKIDIYECSPIDTDFKLVQSPSSSFVGLDRIFGTYFQDKFCFYIAAANTHIYYSDNAGANWVTKNSANSGDGDINPRTVYPTKPNVIFSGYLDVNSSANYGSSFSNFSHLLGWDVHHMKMYQKKDKSYFHFVGKDFGCYISSTPDVASSYVQLNNSSPAQMCYDACNSQEYNSSFTATQDRGSLAFMGNTEKVFTQDVRTTDGLRVTVANNGESVWTWMYFGTIYHTSNFTARKSSLNSLNFTGNWWAAPMIVSPNVKEDAVFVAAGNKLKKFTYNPVSESIIQTEHYFDFSKETNSEITGFGYSQVNTKRWYVSVKTGDFFYSEDGGQKFKRSLYGGTLPRANDATYNYQKNQHVIKASKTDEKKVFYAGVGNVFLVSNDGGITFTNHDNGLDVYRIRDFALSPDEKFIFAACASAGLWVFSVEKDKWFAMNDQFVPIVDFSAVEYLEKENTLSVASYGSGIMKFKIEGSVPLLLSPENLKSDGVSEEQISLKWDDRSDNETGFEIERSTNGEFVKLATLLANSNSYTDKSLIPSDLFTYRVKAINATTGSFYSNYALVEFKPGDVSKKNWKLVSVNSEETYTAYPGNATLAFDDNPGTFWHTQWYQVNPLPGYPHQMVIDMNETLWLKGFSYLPRQDGNPNGRIKDYEFYVSMDKTNWQLASKSSWTNSGEKKEVFFSGVFQARYIKLVALSEVNGAVFASCAELSVLTKVSAAAAPNAPQFIQGGMLTDSEIELVWLDLSKNEEGFTVEQQNSGVYSTVSTTGSDVTSFKLQNASKTTKYTFRISAFNNLGKSPYSETITINSNAGTVGIEDKPTENSGLIVFPNPFDREIRINFSEQGFYTNWQIVDVKGGMVEKGTIPASMQAIAISTGKLKSGTYFIEIIGKGRKETIKMIK